MRRDVTGYTTFADAEAVRRYVGSSSLGAHFVDKVPGLSEPLVARKLVSVFVATKTA